VALALAAAFAEGQAAPHSNPPPAVQSAPQIASPASAVPAAPEAPVAALPAPGTDPLFHFASSEIKFRLDALMALLRDRRHEGWVLAAYPDPHTARPLIGAGFSLDVPVTPHPQLDPLNPHPFLEPSSAQLWQAAGLDPARLDAILAQYRRDFEKWNKRGFRRRIRKQALLAQITDEEATSLLRISAIQAIYNAKAYCRYFDQLTASQQMAFSQLVYQMGTNLAEFTNFLNAVNNNSPAIAPASAPTPAAAPAVTGGASTSALLAPAALPATAQPALVSQAGVAGANSAGHWSSVQQTLMESQWAHKYSLRAASVIAMFDPDYARDPASAEQRITAVLRPPRRAHGHRASRSTASLRLAKYSRHSSPAKRKHSGTRARRGRKST
jgi:hypothetical protein